MEKIFCKDLKKEIDTIICHSHREKRQICKECSFNKSYPLMERPTGAYKETFIQTAEAYREHYEKGGNPIFLFRTFTDAVMYKAKIPLWVINKIDEVFQRYLYDEFQKDSDRSLDLLFGCMGRGKDTVRENLYLRGRNVRVNTDIAMLGQRGIGPKDAAIIAYGYNQETYLPNPEKLRQEYHSKWKKQFDEVGKYNEPKRLEALLNSAPEGIKKKKRYQKIFKESF